MNCRLIRPATFLVIAICFATTANAQFATTNTCCPQQNYHAIQVQPIQSFVAQHHALIMPQLSQCKPNTVQMQPSVCAMQMPMMYHQPPMFMPAPMVMHPPMMAMQPSTMATQMPNSCAPHPAMTWQPIMAPPFAMQVPGMAMNLPTECQSPKTFSGDRPDECDSDYNLCCDHYGCAPGTAGKKYCECLFGNCIDPFGPQEPCIQPTQN